MSRIKTWKVQEWEGSPQPDNKINLACQQCGTEAACPTHGSPNSILVGAFGMRILAEGDIQKGFLPDAIQCRVCRVVYAQ